MSRFQNPNETKIRKILDETHSIAVVGLSPHRHRPSHRITQYLIQVGYEVVGVRPDGLSVLGLACYSTLSAIPHPVDLVNVFRRPSAVAEHVEQAIEIRAKSLWLQLGVIDSNAAELARDAALDVVMDRCILVEHARLIA